MLAHQRARVREARLQRRAGAFIARTQRIAERDRHVAQPPFMADAADRTALGVVQEFFFAPGEELDELAASEPFACIEIRQRAFLRELVPRADELAVVAAIDPV